MNYIINVEMALWRVLDKTSGSLRSPSSTRRTNRPNITKRQNRRKSKDGNEKSGFARRLSAKPRFFLLPVALNCAFSICRVLLPQNYRFCNSREFTACACLDTRAATPRGQENESGLNKNNDLIESCSF